MSGDLRLERLDHLVLTVRDLAATCAFYETALGMRPVTFGHGRRALAFGQQKLNLHEADGGLPLVAARPTPGSADLCFLTDRALEDWTTHLRGCGVPLLEGPVRRTGALGPIDSIYLRDPDDNLIEISRAVDGAGDALAPIRDWLRQWQACVRAGDFVAGRALCSPDLIAFGTVAPMVQGIDRVMQEQWQHVWPDIRDFTIHVEEARGTVSGDHAWVATTWDSRGVRADGSTFQRPGRLTIALARRDGRWLALHTHFSLVPQRA